MKENAGFKHSPEDPQPIAYAICPDCRVLGRCVLGIPATFRAGEGCKATDTGKTAIYSALKKKGINGKPQVKTYLVSGRIVEGASWCHYVRGRRDEPGEKRRDKKPPKTPMGPNQGRSDAPSITLIVPVPPDLTAPPAARHPSDDSGQQACPPPPPPPAQASSTESEAES